LHIKTTHRSGFLPAPIRMTLNDLECPIHLKVRLMDARLTYGTFVAGFRFDHTHGCSQRERRGSGLEGLPPSSGQS